MIKNFKVIVMALVAMTFMFESQPTFAADEEVAKEVKKTASQVVTAVQREIQKHSIGFGLGQTFLLGSFEKKGDNKITADLFYAYTASYSFDFLINFHSSNHSYRSKEVRINGLAMSVKARAYEFDAFSPFILGGLGFYRPQIVKDGNESEIKNTFGLNAGAGVDLRLNNKYVIGMLGQYHMPFDVKQDEMEDVRGSYFKLLMTAMYIF